MLRRDLMNHFRICEDMSGTNMKIQTATHLNSLSSVANALLARASERHIDETLVDLKTGQHDPELSQQCTRLLGAVRLLGPLGGLDGLVVDIVEFGCLAATRDDRDRVRANSGAGARPRGGVRDEG